MSVELFLALSLNHDERLNYFNFFSCNISVSVKLLLVLLINQLCATVFRYKQNKARRTGVV